MNCEVAYASEDILGECPVWSAAEQALWWVDIRGPILHRLEPSSGAHKTWTFPELCPGIALARNGLVIAGLRTLSHFDPATGRTRPLIEVEPASLDNRLNELRCDRQGRLWVGSMRDLGSAVTGSLYRIDPAHPTPTRLVTDIRIPNGLAWSPDNRTMYFSDTGDRRIRAYDFDATTGALGKMRVHVEADTLTGGPDGATIDAEGCLWTTRYGAGMIARVAPDGRIDRTVALPATQPTSCIFGGADLKTLFITTARQRLTPEALAAQPLAGALLSLRLDVGGLPEPVFAG